MLIPSRINDLSSIGKGEKMEKLTPEKAKWLAERYYKGMEKRDASMAKIFYPGILINGADHSNH